jgi:glycosyltransferase involved in cell wall biosynthesis
VEAAASGLPVVVSDVGGLAELVVDGETGWRVPPADPQALADALGRLIDDRGLARRLGAAGRVRAERQFDLRRNARRLVELAMSCVDDGG